MKMKTRSEYHVNGSQESEKEMQCKSSRPRKRFMHPATMFFLLGIAVVLLSWVGSVYNWNGVQNLLSTEAMRWILRYSSNHSIFRLDTHVPYTYLCAVTLKQQ
ncbi:MAG: hypothetical protein SOX26_10830 [Phocaeicola sp.]|nr:hypothetical protein [Phocaeicola sp.]